MPLEKCSKVKVVGVQLVQEQVVNKRKGEQSSNFSKYCHIFRSITCVSQINVHLSVNDSDHNLS
jgi:hypothetical protein